MTVKKQKNSSKVNDKALASSNRMDTSQSNNIEVDYSIYNNKWLKSIQLLIFDCFRYCSSRSQTRKYSY
jgi:hypothetical protein